MAINTVNSKGITDATITEDDIAISNAPSDGKFLQYKDSSDKLTWADVPAGIGGATGVGFNDDVMVQLGSSNEGQLYHNTAGATVFRNNADGKDLYLQVKQNSDIIFQANDTGNQNAAIFKWSDDATPVSSVELYYGGVKKAETVTGGFTITGACTATSFAGDGSALTGIASTTLDGCAYENDQTISAGTYSIAAGKGAHSVGPITNNGTVTVNGTWVIS